MAASRSNTSLRHRLAHEAGTSLVEVVVAAALLAVVAVGVMSGLDVAARVSGDQKGKAVAGNVAQDELEKARGLDPSQIVTTGVAKTYRDVGGVRYTVERSGRWVAKDPVSEDTCGVSGGATYLAVTVAVSWPGGRKPVELESTFAPGVLSGPSTTGALSLRVVDEANSPVAGVLFTLTGGGPSPGPKTTNADGRVVWPQITAGTWSVDGNKANYVASDGNLSITDTISVPGRRCVQEEYRYSAGLRISGSFYSTRQGSAAQLPSAPQRYVIAHSSMNYQGQSYRVESIPPGQTTFQTPPLYPHTGPYTIWAGACTAPPAAPGIAAAVAGSSGARVKLPSLNIRTRDFNHYSWPPGYSSEAGDTVTTVCGTTYRRRTRSSDGRLDDPGFPYTTSARVCGNVRSSQFEWWDGGDWSRGVDLRKTVTVPNTNYDGISLDFNAAWFHPRWWDLTYHEPTNGFRRGDC